MIIAALAGVGVALSAAAGAVVGIVVGGRRLWRKREISRADARKPSLEAYLHNARSFFSPQELVEQMEAGGKGFAPLL
jgi:hypothetical protein